jgi:hypothetical protein
MIYYQSMMRHSIFPAMTRQSKQSKKYRGIKQLINRPLYGPNFYLLLTN